MSIRPIHLGEEQWRKARELAARAGTSAEDVANRAVDALYDAEMFPISSNGPAQRQTLHDALLASGSLGALKDAPRDLSTNPEYMKDFGESPRE